MGGGMARSLLRSEVTSVVLGYDLNINHVEQFRQESKVLGKSGDELLPVSPLQLQNYITERTDVVLLALVNEDQCRSVCFGGNIDNSNGKTLEQLMRPGSVVLVSSTLSPQFCEMASKRFHSGNSIKFCDCPISGGPVKALSGEITIMVSSDDDSTIDIVYPLLEAMGKHIYIVKGGVGRAMSMKIVHQLLAGTHIVAAAEAINLAQQLNLDIEQLYDIVCGAAGNSWMFEDRGQRMVSSVSKEGNGGNIVKSAMEIFVKDMGLVNDVAAQQDCPTPIADIVKRRFELGASSKFGLSKRDDSSILQVYQHESSLNNQHKEEIDDNDLWVFPDGTVERIVEVGHEMRHKTVILNEYVRVLKVKFGPDETTSAHRHKEDSLYFFLVENGLNVINHVMGYEPQCDCMDFGEVRYGSHKTDKPLVHKITNKNTNDMFCIDAEILKKPPVSYPIPLLADNHELIKTRNKCRVYKLTLQPGESIENISYPFFHLKVVLNGTSKLLTVLPGNTVHKPFSSISYETKTERGDVEWNTPILDFNIKNCGETTYEQFVVEWR